MKPSSLPLKSETHCPVAVETALRIGLALVEPVAEVERVPLEQAHGRVLATSVQAQVPLPQFDNAAMDGYAVRLADLSGNGPWGLPIAGRLAAGDQGGAPLVPGSAFRIFTGAPVPLGCDAVVMQEAVRKEGRAICLDARPAWGDNIRRVGEDLAAGAVLMQGGRCIGPRAAALLASAGCGDVPLRRRVRVAFFSTGSELRSPGTALLPGQIWNANRYHLQGSLDLPWVEAIDMGSVPDKPDLLRAMLERASQIADLVVSTGGVAVGEEDHMPAVLLAAGGDIHVSKVAMKPGKSLVIGKLGSAIYLGLPGNPVAAFVGWYIIGERIAKALAGMTETRPESFVVRADFQRPKARGRCEYLPASLNKAGDGLPSAAIVTSSVSHRVALLAQADGLVLIPADVEQVRCGDLLEFLPFRDR